MRASFKKRIPITEFRGGKKLRLLDCLAQRSDTTSSSATTEPPASASRELLLLGGVLFTSLLLRLPFLGQTALYFDEIWSITACRMPWRSVLWIVIHVDSNTSAYYALLHLWIHLGDSEATVRLLSVMLGSVTVIALYALGNRLFGKPAGLIAGLLFAVNGFHIMHSQQARSYSLVVLLSTLSSLFFVMCIERPVRRNWLGYVLTSVLAIYAHLFAVLALAALWGSLVCLRRRDVPWKGLLVSTAIVGALTSPLGLLVFARGAKPLVWVPKPTVHSISFLFYTLTGPVPSAPGGKPLVAAYFVICLVAVLSGIKAYRSLGRSFETWHLGLPLACLFLPIVLALAISVVQPVLYNQYLMICLPPLTLLAAKGIQAMTSRWVAAAALATIVSLAALALQPYYQRRYDQCRFNHQGWESATSYLLARARPGDAIMFCAAPGRLQFDYYLRGRYSGLRKDFDVVFPEFGDEARDPTVVTYTPPLRSGLLEYVTTHYSRVWVLLNYDRLCASYHDKSQDKLPLIQASLSARYTNVQETRVEEAIVLLYSDRKGGVR